MSSGAIENAAREYVEIIWMGCEPTTSAEATFERVMHRKPTPDESRKMAERVRQLSEGYREGQSAA
jgi:sulfatase maturation enzyme AslB (radical SAM superfamily)